MNQNFPNFEKFIEMTKGQKVAVALSGGVDSAVALMLLKNAGIDVTAIFMKNWEEDDDEKYCSAAEDYKDAISICHKLSVPLRAINFSSEYWDDVFSYFLAEHENGNTPNPDVWCNPKVKFGVLNDYAMDIGLNYLATGHYARLHYDQETCRLLRAADIRKDQTYFLYRLNQAHLHNSFFPLGDLSKSEVRQLANDNGISVYDKKGSTGICFIGERPFQSFLKKFIKTEPGDFVSIDGKKVGMHQGLPFYTLGQRQGLKIGGLRNGSGEPWYVCKKNTQSNTITVVQGKQHPALYRTNASVNQINWVDAEMTNKVPVDCNVQIRYQHRAARCRLEWFDENRLRLTFEQPQWALTPGQSAVFYLKEECIGGGIIEPFVE